VAADFAAATIRLDESFAHRFLSDADVPLSAESSEELRAVVRERLAAIQKRRAELESLSLLEPHAGAVQTQIDSVSATTLRFLDRYTDDIYTKLNVFEGLAQRLKAFQNIINRNYFLKCISLDRNHGFRVRSTISGRPLSLALLSAGEQHELLIIHKLLFDTQPGTLLLLDEPELSLHVEWQEKFIQDLIELCSLGQCDAIVATHSPVLVADFWHLTTSLSEEIRSLDELTKGYEEIVEYGTWG
jgi:hypothetical protein